MHLIRISWIICFVAVATMQSNAQNTDTSIFFRYASTFDNLLPETYGPLTKCIPDSASLEVFGVQPKNRTMEKRVSYEYNSESTKSEEQVGRFRYAWDGEARLTEYSSFSPGDTTPYERVRAQYLNGNKPSNVFYSTPAVAHRIDTVSFQYNRMGLVGTWNYRTHSVDSNSNQTGTRLYDSRGRVIVATNMMYGPLRGSYTYEYNSNGQLIRRTFNAGGSGVVLCTDTIEYAALTPSSSIIMVSHRLKVAGMEKWKLMETKTIYPYSGVVMSYSDYNDADSNYLYGNYPEYTVRYTYDGEGRLIDEHFGTIANPDLFHAKYYYGKYNQPDSIVYSERIIEKKSTYTRVYSADIREYDNDGKIIHREIKTILFEEQKKKDKMTPVEIVIISYLWK